MNSGNMVSRKNIYPCLNLGLGGLLLAGGGEQGVLLLVPLLLPPIPGAAARALCPRVRAPSAKHSQKHRADARPLPELEVLPVVSVVIEVKVCDPNKEFARQFA